MTSIWVIKGSEEAGPQFKKAPKMKYESVIHMGVSKNSGTPKMDGL